MTAFRQLVSLRWRARLAARSGPPDGTVAAATPAYRARCAARRHQPV